ncbi:hypothetical protein BBJ28_00019681 [Nothophytophthora sp. Chile5]|nr:hypothetical protein BBJ28_00019681 [Nothophytophthora sp. Chile5]
MGAATSSNLVDCVVDGDIHGLKTLLQLPGDASAATKDASWALELEEAVHTVVATEMETGQHLQQLQIALELLLQARPEAWSSTAASSGADNNESNDSRASYNPAGWSACHRACATGNLGFVAFVLQHHAAQFELQTRDAFGLFPIDLVPPELLLSAEEVAAEPQSGSASATARSRRSLALQRLRARKAELQTLQLRSLVAKAVVPSVDECFVAFEPQRDHLASDQACNMGNVHERDVPLRVTYRVPRAEPFVNGYFQLIWRELGDARGDEPHYDARVTRLRDEPEETEAPVDTATSTSRSLADSKTVLEGGFLIDVGHLPDDCVCHVLFIACDRHMLHRTIALSTEGLALQTPDAGDPDSDDYHSDTTSEGEDQRTEGEAGYTFTVAGEEFVHPNAVFAGLTFEDVTTFESFLRDLRLKKQRRMDQQEHDKTPDKSEGVDSSENQQEQQLRPPEEPQNSIQQPENDPNDPNDLNDLKTEQ